MRKYASLIALGAGLVLAGAGCYGTTPTTTTGVEPTKPPVATGRAVIGITDASVTANGVTAVVATISEVAIHGPNDGWVVVSSSTKTYDLLQLKNASVTKLLADATVAVGTYDQIRLNVSGVQVTASGTVKVAKLPSNTLKIVGNFTVAADQTSTAVVDFDLEKSLHLTGNGLFIFAPVVRLETKGTAKVEASTDGSIEISEGETETDMTVGADVDGETKRGFVLPSKLEIDAEGRVKVLD